MITFSYLPAHNLSGTLHKLLIQRMTFAFCLCLLLPACNLNQVIKDDETTRVDMLEIEKLAAEAYERGDLAEGEKHYSVMLREMPIEIRL